MQRRRAIHSLHVHRKGGLPISDLAYSITIHTPLGKRRGELVLHQHEEQLSGHLLLLGYETVCEGTLSEKGDCILQGEIQTFMSRIPFTGQGTATDNGISLMLLTRAHRFPLEGTRIAPQAAKE